MSGSYAGVRCITTSTVPYVPYVLMFLMSGFVFSETGFLGVVLAVLEITLETRLTLNLEICLPLSP